VGHIAHDHLISIIGQLIGIVFGAPAPDIIPNIAVEVLIFKSWVGVVMRYTIFFFLL